MSIFTEMPFIEVVLGKGILISCLLLIKSLLECTKFDEPLKHVNNCYMSKCQGLLIALVICEGIQLKVIDPQNNQVHNGVNIVFLEHFNNIVIITKSKKFLMTCSSAFFF
jgi:hypothetical protein